MALMDADGKQKAENICAQINGIQFDEDLPNKILEEGNLVLDETGMLAVKTLEGLSEISNSASALITKKSELINVVKREGNELRNNYDAYLRKEAAKKRAEQIKENDLNTGSVNTSSSVTSNSVLRKDKVQSALR